jgi:hypothetical protein
MQTKTWVQSFCINGRSDNETVLYAVLILLRCKNKASFCPNKEYPTSKKEDLIKQLYPERSF